MTIRILVPLLLLLFITPAKAQTVTELKSIIAIQQSEIKNLQSQIQGLNKPVVIKAVLSSTILGTSQTCGSVCEANEMICLDGRLGKSRPIKLGETKTRNLGCYAGASSQESIAAHCVCMAVDAL